MFLGIDVGTSGVKAVLLGAAGIVAEATAPLSVSRPRPLWSEQDPRDWRTATDAAAAALRAAAPEAWRAVRGIGLAGQMHGAVLLDAADRVLRPAILWNDGRSAAECADLERRVPALRAITGNKAMPGFTAPKLLWVAAHEPDVFVAVRRVLLPKDWLRLDITGDAATDMSDASGTLWLDVGARRWSEDALAACGLSLSAMPAVVEGPAVTGTLRAEVAAAWGLGRVPVVAGGGDNACAAVGIGAVSPARGFLSLGTSGVYFLPTASFAPDPGRAIHAFAHALPGLWHVMAVTLSAASALDWASRALGADIPTLLAEAETAGPAAARGVFFLPYLSGERTPHDDPNATGSFHGLRHADGRGDLARAVLEGVALSLADASEAMTAGAPEHALALVGGGSRSALWARIVADALGRPVERLAGGEVGPSLGAARLAWLGVDGADARDVLAPPAVADRVAPEDGLRGALAAFRGLYRPMR